MALDTAGCVPWENLAAILAYADTVLFNIKAFDPEIHRRCTGVDNALILENAKRIAALGKRLFLRMVVVPGYNDQKDDLLRRLSFAAELGNAVEQVDLLKYHTLGEGKYARLGIPYPVSAPPCGDGEMETLRGRRGGHGPPRHRRRLRRKGGTLMNAAQRRMIIFQKLEEQGTVEVSALSSELGVSTMTIRRDLSLFEKQGLVKTNYGGAYLLESAGAEPSFALKQGSMSAAKAAIGAEAARIASGCSSVVLDCGHHHAGGRPVPLRGGP